MKDTAIHWIDSNKRTYEEIARYLWDNPELGLVEFKAAQRLGGYLAENGFSVQTPVSGMPSGFVATWGSGEPTVGFLAEYDAIPNLSQETGVSRHEPVLAGAPGHGCGHNLLGTSGCTAAIATKTAMEKHGLRGTVKVFGTPAEEALIGKAFMARDGVFDGTDIVISWHPYDRNEVDYKSFPAVTSIKFRFVGKASHAGSNPEDGRNALGAAELMNVGVNFMREHVNERAKLMHVITRGGESPGTIPAVAEVWYMIQAPRRSQVVGIEKWMQDVGRGAALMTQTAVSHQILAATCEVLPNRVLAKVGDANLSEIGAPDFTPEDQAFGDAMIAALGRKVSGDSFNPRITHPDFSRTFPDVEVFNVATDLANVSWLIPTLHFRIAAKATGTPHHSWFMVAQTASPPALKAGLRVSQWMAASALDCITHPKIVSEAWKEHGEYLLQTEFTHPIAEDIELPSFKDVYGMEPDRVPGRGAK
jgi:aminobenzoyl-glutamate utilization protein B